MADELEGTPTPPAPISDGPWRADIEASFADPQVRASVDAFLRSKVQPHTTKLEQQIAAAEQAQMLWQAFQEDPAGAYAAVTEELTAAGILQSDAPVPVLEATPELPQEPVDDPRLSRLEQIAERWEQREELEAYDHAVDEVLADPANSDINRNLYHGFVAAADGDFERALELYRADAAEREKAVIDRLGITPEQLAEWQAANRQEAPPVLGNEGGGSGATPTEVVRHGQDGLNAAIDDVFARMNDKSAPPVA